MYNTTNFFDEFCEDVDMITQAEEIGLYDHSEYEGLIEIPQLIDEDQAQINMNRKLKFLKDSGYYWNWGGGRFCTPLGRKVYLKGALV